MAGKRKTAAKKNDQKSQQIVESSSTTTVDVVSTDDNNNNNNDPSSSSSKRKKPSTSKIVETETVTLRRSARATTKASTAASVAKTPKKTSASDSKSKTPTKSNRRNIKDDKSIKSEPIQEEITEETPKGKKKSKATSSTTKPKKAAASKKKVPPPEEINEESASTSVETKNLNKKKNAKNNKQLVVEEETEPLEPPPEPTPKRSKRTDRKKEEPESIKETPKVTKKPVKKSARNNKKETITEEEQEEDNPVESTEDVTAVASTSSKKRSYRGAKLTEQKQKATIATDSNNDANNEVSEDGASESKTTRPKRKTAATAPSTSKESKPQSTRSTRRTAPSSSKATSAVEVETVEIVVNIKSNKEPNKTEITVSGQNNRNKKSVRFAKQVQNNDDNVEESEKTENDQKDEEQMEYVSSTTTATTTADHEEKKEEEVIVPRIDEPDDEDMTAVTDEDDGQNDDKNQATTKSKGITKTASGNNEPAIEMETLMPSSTNESEEEKQQNYIVKEMENEEDDDNIPDDNNNNNVGQDKKDAMITEIVENDEKQSEQLKEKEEKISENNNKVVDNVIPLPPPPSMIMKQTESSTIANSNGSIQNDGDQGSKLVMDIDDDAGEAENDKNYSKLKRKSANVIEDDLMPQKKRLREDDCGDLFTMGEQISKELGPRETNFNGKKVLHSEPSRVKIGSKVKISQVATGALHTLALTEDGQVLSFGCNDDCVLGRPLTREENSNGQANDDNDTLMDVDDDDLEEVLSGKPLPVKEINTKVVKVTAGDMHSAALCHDGKVYIWGNFKDESDKIGLFVDCEKSPSSSDYLPIIYPRLVEFDMNVVDIASGSHHLLMLTDQGKVYTFGEGSKGQLGRITSTELNSIKTKRDLFLRPNPVSIPDSDFIEHVFASQWNSYALSKDGVLYGWGLNNYYQLGIKNDFISQANSLNSGSLFTLIPTRIPVQLKVKQIANGQQHSLLLNDDGKVYSCGSALYGKLGHGEDFVKQCGEDYSISEFKNIPQKCFNDERIVKVDCGDFCSMAISESGKLFCWGQGASHIGTEDGVDLFEPKKISGAFADCTKFLTISTGAQMASMVGIVREQQQP